MSDSQEENTVPMEELVTRVDHILNEMDLIKEQLQIIQKYCETLTELVAQMSAKAEGPHDDEDSE
jgi:hypothetical protein